MDDRTEEAYRFDEIEDTFHDALEESLDPQGPEALFDLVATFDLPAGAASVDVGCRRGEHTRALAGRFGFDMVGVDPISRPAGIRFEPGTAQRLPLPDESVDLVWCRDVLSHVADLPRAFAEMRRVLRPGGRAIVYLMLAGERLEPREAETFFELTRVVGSSFDASRVEAAIAAGGLRIDERLEIGSEWGELAEEQKGKPGRRLLWAARLLRDPERYVARFGRTNYESCSATASGTSMRWSESSTAARTHSRARRRSVPATCGPGRIHRRQRWLARVFRRDARRVAATGLVVRCERECAAFASIGSFGLRASVRPRRWRCRNRSSHRSRCRLACSRRRVDVGACRLQ
jgi:SAM-dependent methyltransferase